MTKIDNNLTADEFAHILAQSGAAIVNQGGTCRVYFAKGDNAFVMQGPSGSHKLFAPATDLNRLNAHWNYFAAR